jgi:hypothetical protein
MVDAYSDFYDECPVTHCKGSSQIDLISVSQHLAPYVTKAYILAPSDSEGDHSMIGIDFDFGSLTSNTDLSDIDPAHAQNRILVSTDVKASSKFLDLVKKKNNAHNATNRLRALHDQSCERMKRCTQDDRRLLQTLSNLLTAMPNKLKLSARKLADLPGPECLRPWEKWYNMPTKSTAGARIMRFLNPMNPMMMHLHELSKTDLMLNQPNQNQSS